MKGWENVNSIDKLKARGMVAEFTAPVMNELLKKVKRSNRHEESDLQINCVKVFGLYYPKYSKRLRSNPNEGERNNGQKLLDMGMLPGVLDLELALKRKGYGAMYIEIKTVKGRLSEAQKAFIIEYQEDYYCCVVRSVEGFLKEVREYLNQ